MNTDSLKVIWITGASSGIGWYTAFEAARRGYAVCVNYLRDKMVGKALKV